MCDIYNKLLAEFPSVAGKECVDHRQTHCILILERILVFSMSICPMLAKQTQ